jgi:hypothetical protein
MNTWLIVGIAYFLACPIVAIAGGKLLRAERRSLPEATPVGNFPHSIPLARRNIGQRATRRWREHERIHANSPQSPSPWLVMSPSFRSRIS